MVNPAFKHKSLTLEGGIPNVPRPSPPTAIEVVIQKNTLNPYIKASIEPKFSSRLSELLKSSNNYVPSAFKAFLMTLRVLSGFFRSCITSKVVIKSYCSGIPFSISSCLKKLYLLHQTV
ncbi:hypothetical protein LCGC14_0991600 [marine sediment metagenome]|uniref:Uncharacterized protein n=1 Tax=marine sediment metagenome TaxID=412755 RepID=A0A0F9RCB5_9ZZZZ